MSKTDKHQSILGDLNLGSFSSEKPNVRAARVEKASEDKPAKGETEMFRTSFQMNRKVHDVLREIAFTERTSVTALIMEGLDSVLKSRRHPSTSELADKA